MEYIVLAIVVIGIFVLAVKHGDRLIEYDIARDERQQAEQREADRRASQARVMGRRQ